MDNEYESKETAKVAIYLAGLVSKAHPGIGRSIFSSLHAQHFRLLFQWWLPRPRPTSR